MPILGYCLNATVSSFLCPLDFSYGGVKVAEDLIEVCLESAPRIASDTLFVPEEDFIQKCRVLIFKGEISPT
ncbi:hypothetical protein H6P81_003487 [Aristolochia fimbriata]|uniref:Uncharacterized protein n=1 Tax=Aristolochia fimbriata TaxID=158543 RepID=A0AAV7FEL8_ARIFI|nr:hypothetical protein H6P81_003487 [Aristolochia fimbriata]